MNDFRFSPRPNRAADIGWMPWGTEAFDRARAEGKPILLSISAVWCHWCHVMDETSYSDSGVIDAINRQFVPVRVDNDRRPDVNARYNMGGWPTTAFLAPDGTTLTGATYLPPQQMRRALDEIAQFYAERKDEIAQRSGELRARAAEAALPGVAELSDAPIAEFVDQLERAYDEEYGGFGDAPKFPQPEALELLLSEWRLASNQRLYDMVAKTMLAMARGGMYDHVEGGFFRYSTTRDWSVPHFEKMAEDHAGLLRVLATLVIFAPTREFHETLTSAASYVRHVLRDPQTGFYGGSQDADEAYYELPLQERRRRPSPYVDRTSYTNWTCALAGAQCLAARALDDDAMLREALTTLDNVGHRLIGEDGVLYHVLAPGEIPEVRGLLTDHVAYFRALLDAHEISGKAPLLDRARTLCERVIEKFEASDGGFYDRIPGNEALGRLSLPDRPIVENGILAESFLRLSALTGETRYREHAVPLLQRFAPKARASGPFAATYCRALRRYLLPELTVRIVGEPSSTDAFREAALRLPSPVVTIRTLAPRDAVQLALPPEAAAYVCVTGTCGAPVREPGALRDAYDALAG
ncbi:MAG: thioredoxin domain-containing protein [Candidatus Eremiobacteraeota bacterium]|nr:thioredoxin domain-containing protein [Candidatus Eremiobacteraeota bacterium]